MSRAIVAALALIILAISGAYAVEASLESAGDDHTITNESFTPTADTVIALSESNRGRAYYNHNVTVYDDTTTEMDPGTDYTWFVGNGTIKPLSGGDLAGDTSATITYGYQLPSEREQTMATLLSYIPQLLGLFIPAIGLIIFLAFLRGA